MSTRVDECGLSLPFSFMFLFIFTFHSKGIIETLKLWRPVVTGTTITEYHRVRTMLLHPHKQLTNVCNIPSVDNIIVLNVSTDVTETVSVLMEPEPRVQLLYSPSSSEKPPVVNSSPIETLVKTVTLVDRKYCHSPCSPFIVTLSIVMTKVVAFPLRVFWMTQ